MFTATLQNGTEVVKNDADDVRVILTSPDFPPDTHIEIHFSEDGAVFVEVWDEERGEYTASRTIAFDELFEAYDS